MAIMISKLFAMQRDSLSDQTTKLSIFLLCTYNLFEKFKLFCFAFIAYRHKFYHHEFLSEQVFISARQLYNLLNHFMKITLYGCHLLCLPFFTILNHFEQKINSFERPALCEYTYHRRRRHVSLKFS